MNPISHALSIWGCRCTVYEDGSVSLQSFGLLSNFPGSQETGVLRPFECDTIKL